MKDNVIFLKALGMLNQVYYLSPNKTGEIYIICKGMLDNNELSQLDKLITLYNDLGSMIPEVNYNLLIDLHTNMAEALISQGKTYYHDYFSDTTYYPKHMEDYIKFNILHVAAMKLYIFLAKRLEKLGLPRAAYDYLLKSIDPWVTPYNHTSSQGDFYLENIEMFDFFLILQIETGNEEIRLLLLERAGLYFQIIKVLGNINDSGKEVFEKYKQFVNYNFFTKEDCTFYANHFEVLALEKRNNDKQLVIQREIDYLTKEIYPNLVNDEHKFIISNSIARSIQDKLSIKKANELINPEKYWQEKFHLEALSLTFNKYDGKLIDNIIKEFFIVLYQRYPNRKLSDLIKQRNSPFINTIFSYLIDLGNYAKAVQVLYAWVSMKPNMKDLPSISNKSIFILAPHYNTVGAHAIISTPDEIIHIPYKSNVTLIEINKARNEVESVWNVTNDESVEFNETVIESLRKLRVEQSKGYIESLSKFINIEELVNEFNKLNKQHQFEYIELPWLNTPILPVISTKTNHTFTITGGHEVIPRTKIHKVLIWFDPMTNLGGFAPFEFKAITKIFTDHNIIYEQYTGDQCTKELFIKEYSSEEYDMIWIITHGEFNYNDPHESLLYISKNETISSWELEEHIPFREEKRYLILNACQTGIAGSWYNSLGLLGLGPSLTNKYQSVMGHLWLADSLAASVLGVFTLSFLLKGKTLAEALKEAMKIMILGKTEIITSLKEIDSKLELIERVEFNSKDLSLPFHSMSAVIYE
ncbi:CHAT domain-containing protein [Metabacillus litoralis]|uniref:CHAT domain-containing protein n=1 Tax=Metabacillus litoralis TaxID=152268 RepID=UPI0020419F17|nr:CHAT domain-containing protein [Metabacillus litoralis]MCM3410216.1 CHAT domain-containing protein [Metabacillus litoralis]